MLLLLVPGCAHSPVSTTQPHNHSSNPIVPWLHGKPILLWFASVHCPISNRLTPTMLTLAHDYREHVQFYIVYPNPQETEAEIHHHLREFKITLPHLRDPHLALARWSRVKVTPEVALYDPQGALIYHGRINDRFLALGQARPAPTTHELRDALDALLQGQSPQISHAPAVGCYISGIE
ncbi:MAG: hypothetical protein SFY81_14210 [Verrucomicrobiota bacterium]|nr:hypothetical protein [Verrucomicrobiota bacterium]